jgi:acetate kinase
MQLKHAQKYVEKKTQNLSENDIVIFAGDFNANAQTNRRGAKNYIEHLQGRVNTYRNNIRMFRTTSISTCLLWRPNMRRSWTLCQARVRMS